MPRRIQFGSYSLELPETWTLSSVILVGPVDDAPGAGMPTTKRIQPFQRNLITTMEKVGPSTTAEQYLQSQIKALREAGVPRKDVGSLEKITVGPTEGVISEQIITGSGGERVRQLQLVVIKDGMAHTTIASHLDGASFEKVRQEFTAILKSFA